MPRWALADLLREADRLRYRVAPPLQEAVSGGLPDHDFPTGMVGRSGRCSKEDGDAERRESSSGDVARFSGDVHSSRFGMNHLFRCTCFFRASVRKAQRSANLSQTQDSRIS